MILHLTWNEFQRLAYESDRGREHLVLRSFLTDFEAWAVMEGRRRLSVVAGHVRPRTGPLEREPGDSSSPLLQSPVAIRLAALNLLPDRALDLLTRLVPLAEVGHALSIIDAPDSIWPLLCLESPDLGAAVQRAREDYEGVLKVEEIQELARLDRMGLLPLR